MILLTYCILLTAYSGDPSAFLLLASVVELFCELWGVIGYLMGKAHGEGRL